ncbi:MAG: hypothetical protein O2968_15750 [Acidobacteria bacterium]|nr:hypothetical protein [Acidobacteriota bacterium]
MSRVSPSRFRSLILLLAVLFLLPSVVRASDLVPEALGNFIRLSVDILEPHEADIFDEFGFEEGQQGAYRTADGRDLKVTAYRFQDPTGALAAYQWLRPEGGELVAYGERALLLGDTTVIHFGNFVVRMSGDEAFDEHVEAMLSFLPRVVLKAEPPVLKFVPEPSLIPFSGRYILGPVALQKLASEVPPSVAAFRFGTEGQFVRYQSNAGELRMVLFYYPSPQIAHAQIEEFEQLPNVTAKRSGPMIAAVLSPSSADEAERLLSRVRYVAEVTVTPRAERRHDNLGVLFLDIFIFCGILVVLMLVGGGIVAGSRLLARRIVPNSIIAAPGDADVLRLNIDRRD